MTRNCNPDCLLIRTNSDAIQATIAERSTVAEHHAAHRDDIAVLAHTDDRVVTAVRHIKVGPSFQRGIAGPVGVVLFVHGWGQIDRMVERIRVEATHRRYPEN